MSISSTNGAGRIVYGADSSPTEALEEFARDADLMLVEATLPRPERTGMRGHLTPEEAGEHARGAGAKRLLLVHISDELDCELGARPGGRGVRRPGRGGARGRGLRGLTDRACRRPAVYPRTP